MKKKIIALSLTAAALASLCACGPQIPDVTEKSASTTADSSQTSATEEEKPNIELTIQDSSVNMPDIGNFRIAASFHGSDEKTVDTVSIKPLEFDSQKLTETFFGDQKVSQQVGDNMTFFKTADTNLEYDSGYEFGSSLTYYTEKGLALNELFQFTDYPLKTDELTFKKPDEAKTIVTDILKGLDLPVPQTFKVQSLSHEDLQTICDNFDKYKTAQNVPLMEPLTNYKFSGEDDIYILSWISILNGLDSAMGMRYAIISNNGLEFMSLRSLATADQVVQVDDNSIISVEDAVAGVYEKYKENNYEKLFTVSDISLGYMISGSNSFSPVWFFSGTIGDELFRWGVDAYTGEVSMYDIDSTASGQNILAQL